MNTKTLKDLKKGFGNRTGGFDYIEPDELKAEAIKRAKHYISLLGNAKLSCISYGSPFFKDVNTYDDMNFIGRIVEIVEFNNLTWEDLK